MFCVDACWTLHPPFLLCHCSSRTRTWASLTPDSPDRRQSTARMTPHSATVPSSPLLWDFVLSFPFSEGVFSFFSDDNWPAAKAKCFSPTAGLKFHSRPYMLQYCCSELFLSPLQGFTYVAPSVLESLKEGFSFEPRTRTVRRHNSSPRTPNR